MSKNDKVLASYAVNSNFYLNTKDYAQNLPRNDVTVWSAVPLLQDNNMV